MLGISNNTVLSVTTKEKGIRRMAPEIEGKAANQKSWLVVKLNPMWLSLMTTELNTIQIQNASTRQYTDTQRLRLAMPLPVVFQKLSSSGSQFCNTREFFGSNA